MKPRFSHPLVVRTAARYKPENVSGVFSWAFGLVRSKLSSDPVYFRILQEGLLRDGMRVLDLGCGKAILANFFITAAKVRDMLPDGVQAPRGLHWRGIEMDAGDVAHARFALGTDGEIEKGDIAQQPFGECDAIVILDVLHYLSHSTQDDVLERAYAALSSGGRLLVRVGDAEGGAGFRWSNWVDKTVVFLRSAHWPELACRTEREWIAMLETKRFSVRRIPMSEGTGFANTLLVADKP